MMDQQRKVKLEELKKAGYQAYPYRYEKNADAAAIHAHFRKYSGKKVKVAGRIMAKRGHGKLAFLDLKDGSGRIQAYVSHDLVGKKNFGMLEHLDIGDIIGIEGSVFKTKRGEISVKAKNIEFLAKALLPLPEKWHGLKDTETRYREREVDLLVNEQARRTFQMRSDIITVTREFMASKGFVEVETPVLQPIASGAAAKPFVTYHNALDMNLYLRIALELHQKRLIVGGFEKVFEIGQIFRNEGVSTKHNPEFTMMEFYWAYADYNDLMKFAEEMFGYVAKKVLGTLEIDYQGAKISLKAPWKKMTYSEAFKKYSGVDLDSLKTVGQARSAANELHVKVDPGAGKTSIIDEIFSEKVEPTLIQPTIIYDYPIEMCPLSKVHRKNPELAERFEIYINGWEMVNAYSELNDPVVQKQRFEEQMKDREGGDEEAMMEDDDYVRALEHGMPPTAGWGHGIDRLVMLLTNSPSIRDVILFPSMRAEKQRSGK